MDPAEQLTKLTVARPADKTGSQIFYDHVTLPELAQIIAKAAGKEKSALPWLKLARFGNQRTDKGSLRHDANLLAVVGLEGDYDGGELPFEEACKRFAALGVQGIIYTSPSNCGNVHRWRLLMPFAAEREVTDLEVARAERRGWLDYIAQALGIEWSRESYALSQSYYFGATAETDFHGRLFSGIGIDQLTAHDGLTTRASRTLEQALEGIRSGSELHPNVTAAAMILANRGEPYESIEQQLHEALADCPRDRARIASLINGGELHRIIDSALKKSWHVSAADEFEVIEEQPEPEDCDGEEYAPLLDWDRLSAAPPEPKRALIENWLYAGTVALFAGHGGVGKSLMGLQLAVHMALGRPMLSANANPERVLFYSCEDDTSIVYSRVRRFCDSLGCEVSALSGKMRVRDFTRSDAIMYSDSRGLPQSSKRALRQLERDVLEFEPTLIFIDNASDVFDGSEIARAQVRQFIRMLARIGGDAAIVLLAHVDKSSAKNPETSQGYSGSTAWNNSVRSRWYLYPQESGELILELQKSNYGRSGEKFVAEFDSGMFKLGTSEESRRVLDTLVLSGIYELQQRKIELPVSKFAPGNAYKQLKLAGCLPKGFSAGKCEELLLSFQQSGLLTQYERKGTNRTVSAYWKLTEEGERLCR